MAKRFPITEKQFYDWLKAKPRRKASLKNQRLPSGDCDCPLYRAVLEITGQRVRIWYGIKVPWVAALARRIDDLTQMRWNMFTRGELLRLLENKQ